MLTVLESCKLNNLKVTCMGANFKVAAAKVQSLRSDIRVHAKHMHIDFDFVKFLCTVTQ